MGIFDKMFSGLTKTRNNMEELIMLEDCPTAATVAGVVLMAASLAGVVVLVWKRKTIAYHLRPAPADQGRCLMQVVKSPGVWLFVLVCLGLSIWLVWGV